MFNYGQSYWGTGCGKKLHAEAGLFPGQWNTAHILLEEASSSFCYFLFKPTNNQKNLPAMQETPVGFLGWERYPGGGHGNALQYSWLENPHGQRYPVGYDTWGWMKSYAAEQLSTAHKNQKAISVLETTYEKVHVSQKNNTVWCDSTCPTCSIHHLFYHHYYYWSNCVAGRILAWIAPTAV